MGSEMCIRDRQKTLSARQGVASSAVSVEPVASGTGGCRTQTAVVVHLFATTVVKNYIEAERLCTISYSFG